MYKILRVVSEPPKTEHRSPWGLYVLEVEYSKTAKGLVYLRKDTYKEVLLKQKILDLGVPEDLLDEYKDVISDVVRFDEAIDREE